MKTLVTDAEITRWRTAQGCITQTVRGSHIDITVQLRRAGQGLWWMTVILGGCGLSYIFGQVIAAILSGRVHQLLEAVKVAN